MPKVSWDRKEDIQKALKPKDAYLTQSRKSFRLPPTVRGDFERWLEQDVPNVNYTFELVKDWFALQNEGYSPVYFRAQQTPIDWKSKMGNSDISTNFKTSYDIPIKKGDMVIREDGTVFLLNWNIQNHLNNQATQSIECNAMVEFTREFPDEVNDEGYLLVAGRRRAVVPEIPIVHIEYAGRPDYMSSQGTPGINADHLITCYMQWNDKTKGIEIDDEFIIGQFTYRVVNVSVTEIQIDRGHGILTINAKRVAGGVVNEE
jgi:hypothetical protein